MWYPSDWVMILFYFEFNVPRNALFPVGTKKSKNLDDYQKKKKQSFFIRFPIRCYFTIDSFDFFLFVYEQTPRSDARDNI